MAKHRTYTAGQVARMLEVAPRTVTKWCNAKILPCYCIPGSADRRILHSELLAFMVKYAIPMELIKGYQILVVDKDNHLADRLAAATKEESFVRHAKNAFEAGRFHLEPFEVAVVSCSIGSEDAWLVLNRYMPRVEHLVMVLSEDQVSRKTNRVVAYFQQPCDLDAVVSRVQESLRRVNR